MTLNMHEEAGEYGASFFAGIEEGTRRSAGIIVPTLLKLFSPTSVVDVGGGAGHWAAECLARGVPEVLSIDGPWVPPAVRSLPPDLFLEHDLSRPLTLDRTFDLALCLEAAEHLPSSAAPELVRALTDLAPVVAFSAAIPGQGGDGHINEQLPSYWASLFAARDYVCFSDMRSRLWNDDAVEVWYRQNLLLYIRKSQLDRWGAGLISMVDEGDPTLDVAHPDLLVRQKLRGDRLETYAHGLQADGERLRQEIERLQQELGQCRLELDRITNSRAWRASQLALSTIRRLKKPYPLSSAKATSLTHD